MIRLICTEQQYDEANCLIWAQTARSGDNMQMLFHLRVTQNVNSESFDMTARTCTVYMYLQTHANAISVFPWSRCAILAA